MKTIFSSLNIRATLILALLLSVISLFSTEIHSHELYTQCNPGFFDLELLSADAPENMVQSRKAVSLRSGNILFIKDLTTLAGNDIVVELEILNEDEFVGFQLDIPVPDGFVFITGSGMLNPERIANHEIAAGILPGSSLLRIISYSLTNAAYIGNSGTIATFNLQTPNVSGNYTLEIIEGIIGNINTVNILTGTVNGNILLTEPIPVHTVSFIMLDKDHTFIADAVVTLGAITNPPGNYEFGLVPSGLYDYCVEHIAYNPFYGEVEVYADMTLTVTLTRKVYSIQAVSGNPDYGFVTGSGDYEHGQEAILTATAYNGSQFQNWTDQETSLVASSEPVFQFSAESDGSFIANFIFTVPETRAVKNKAIGDSQQACYDAVKSIDVSNFTINDGGAAIFTAGINITFNPEISVVSGAYLRAYISLDYCANPQPLLASTDFSPLELTETTRKPGTFFKVFPNPTTGHFTLQLKEADEATVISVEIFSMMGERVMHSQLFGQQQYEFDLSNSPRGVYIIRVLQGSEMGIERVIKQ